MCPRQTDPGFELLGPLAEEVRRVFPRASSRRVFLGYGIDDRDFGDQQARLRATPLEDWTLADGLVYLSASWVDDAAGLQRVLPRLLELLGLHLLDAVPLLEALASRLEASGLASWGEPEREAVQGFLAGCWRCLLARAPLSATAAAGSFARVLPDLRPELRELLEEPALSEGPLPVAAFIDAWCRSPLDAQPHAPDAPARAQVLLWLREPRTLAALEAAFFRAADLQEAEALSAAVQLVQAVASGT